LIGLQVDKLELTVIIANDHFVILHVINTRRAR
jgi:hypothetical protein